MGEEDIDCTISDSTILSTFQHYFPSLNARLSIGKQSDLGWLMALSNRPLQDAMIDWFYSLGKDQLNVLKDKYYGHIKGFDQFDTLKFLERVDTRLPKYEALFKKAAETSNFSWTFLASVSYQESHWEPDAKSPTGVRGMMMLTKNTAKSLGIKNRLDVKESIMGGAKV